MHAVKKCQLVHLVGALPLSESARLLQWLVFLFFFFHRVFNENEESFSCICKRRVFFKSGHILLTSTKSTDNVNITFFYRKSFGPNFFPDTSLIYAKTFLRRQIPIFFQLMASSGSKYSKKERFPVLNFRRCETKFLEEKNVIIPIFCRNCHHFFSETTDPIDISCVMCAPAWAVPGLII